MSTPEQVPAELIAGDTWEWTRDLSDYPAGTWSATWWFEKADKNFSVAGTASGATHAAAVTAATSGGYGVGRYRWRLSVTDGSARHTVEEGWLEVLPNPAADGNYDHRTHARRVLDAIEAVIEGRASQDQSSVSIGGRSLARTPIPDLLVLRDKYRAEAQSEANAERIAAGMPTKNRLLVRFTR